MGVLALLWGSSFLWIKLALDGLAPVQVTLIRCVLGAAVLWVMCRFARQRLPRDGVTWRQYEADLEHRIEELHRRIRLVAHGAPPIRPRDPSA